MISISEKGIELLKELEDVRPFVYPDSGGAPTIGIGHLLTRIERSTGKIHLHHSDNVIVSYANGLTDDQMNQLLHQDIEEAERAISQYVPNILYLSQNQVDALISFVFNIGSHAFRESTLLKRIKEGQLHAVPTQMRRWVYDSGKFVQGLANRREKEIQMWEGKR